MPENPKGILYLVATPIGNLADFSFRAVAVLQGIDFIACEDTRHSRPLLEGHGIIKPLAALHEHNEDTASSKLLDRLEQGESMALISDAGTPLINDPGFPLVRLAIERGLRVVPVPGLVPWSQRFPQAVCQPVLRFRRISSAHLIRQTRPVGKLGG